MEYLGIHCRVKNLPELDPDFIPFGVWAAEYEKTAALPVKLAVEREDGKIAVRETKLRGTEDSREADWRYLERYVKFLLWSIGGFRVYLTGADRLAERLKNE